MNKAARDARDTTHNPTLRCAALRCAAHTRHANQPKRAVRKTGIEGFLETRKFAAIVRPHKSSVEVEVENVKKLLRTPHGGRATIARHTREGVVERVLTCLWARPIPFWIANRFGKALVVPRD